MIDLHKTIHDIMQREPQARLRKNRKRLMWYVFQKAGLCSETITKEQFITLPISIEAITRAARRVIEEHDKYSTTKWKDPESDNLEKSFRYEYGKNS